MKRLIYSALALAALSLTACADMLDPESDLVMYEEDNTLSSANDTLYSVMGVVHLMQQVADRTNLLGEVRGDLVTVTESASTDLQALADFTATRDNAYNAPQDYYAIINNCNYFIQTADTAYSKRGQAVFEREMAVMHAFRAWAYLQLAITYGEVPFYLDFISTAKEAEDIMAQPRRGLDYIASVLIDDLRPWANVLPLDYGSIGSFSSVQFFIPVRVLLGELCLWAGRYEEAAQWYHDWIADVDRPRVLSDYSCYWETSSVPPVSIRDSYISCFAGLPVETIALIPMEATAFEGTITHLPDLYTSTEDNDGYFELTWSRGLRDLSEAQAYYYVHMENNVRDTVCVTDSMVRVDNFELGDLRFFSVAYQRSVASSSSSKRNTTHQTIYKFSYSDFVPLYRLSTIYLHFAEALNRAGYPSAAMAILKYGLTYDALDRGYVDPREQETAGSLLTFNRYTFTPDRVKGVHSRGCGDVEANPEYVLPQPTDSLATWADTVAWQQPLVEDLIIAESALETSFEGQRFYDLMRIALRRGDPAYLADRVARRSGWNNPDQAMRSKLMSPSAWYLPLE